LGELDALFAAPRLNVKAVPVRKFARRCREALEAEQLAGNIIVHAADVGARQQRRKLHRTVRNTFSLQSGSVVLLPMPGRNFEHIAHVVLDGILDPARLAPPRRKQNRRVRKSMATRASAETTGKVIKVPAARAELKQTYV
jgi:hypothetical protein